MRIDLTINVDYLPDWGTWEGVRELIQNAKDAETQFGAPMRITHAGGDRLKIANVGPARLDRSALLLGTTSKGDDSCIGKFGEGLKLGMLALVRAGHGVRIHSGSEVWTAEIRTSKRFGAPVLSVETSSGIPFDGVEVTVSRISAQDWATYAERFTFTRPAGAQDLESEGDTILRSEADRGKIFVRGVYVQTADDLVYGYNFARGSVDRDRRMLASWDLLDGCARVWCRVAHEAAGAFVALLEDGAEDVRGINTWSTVPPPALRYIADRFLADHGDAVPVENVGQAVEAGHLGRHGVVVSHAYACVLKAAGVITLTALRASLAGAILDPAPEIGFHEAATLERAMSALRVVRDFDRANLSMVRFRDASLRGMAEPGGKIYLSISLLTSYPDTLRTLIHEHAHRLGGDGSKEHVQEIEATWRDLLQAGVLS